MTTTELATTGKSNKLARKNSPVTLEKSSKATTAIADFSAYEKVLALLIKYDRLGACGMIGSGTSMGIGLALHIAALSVPTVGVLGFMIGAALFVALRPKPADPEELARKLKELKAFRASGMMTQREYNTARKAILSKAGYAEKD